MQSLIQDALDHVTEREAQVKTAQRELKYFQGRQKAADDLLLKRIKQVNKYITIMARRVVKGHGLLQKKVPAWTSKIDLPTLSLRNGDECVLGQLHAKSALASAGFNIDPDTEHRYTDACTVLGLGTDSDDWVAGDLAGFNVDESTDNKYEVNDTQAYEVLNHLWERAIRLTRGNRPVTVESVSNGLLIK